MKRSHYLRSAFAFTFTLSCLILLSFSNAAWSASGSAEGKTDKPSSNPEPNPLFDPFSKGGQLIKVPPRTATFLMLDKITARKKIININSGEIAEFGTLFVRLRYCEASPPEAVLKEAKVFVEIYEKPPGGGSIFKRLFHGWMFASTPGLNGLEHAVYDLWPIACKDR